MRQLTSIVAVNQDGVIGCANSLPWRIKSDLAFFREYTSNNIVIMGRKTHDSLGRCLPNRYNIVLSKQFSLFDDSESCVLRNSVAEALSDAEDTPKRYKEIFVIGGSTMYAQFDPLIDRYLITVVDKKVPNGDAFFDLRVLQDETQWVVNKVASRQQNAGDEAPYEIFELRARDEFARRQTRLREVNAHIEKRGSRAKRSTSNAVGPIGLQTSLAL